MGFVSACGDKSTIMRATGVRPRSIPRHCPASFSATVAHGSGERRGDMATASAGCLHPVPTCKPHTLESLDIDERFLIVGICWQVTIEP